MTWRPFSYAGAGARGSEGGEVLCDEEYDGCARITLEQGGRAAPFAITCGIYGWMVHTRFFRDGAAAEGSYKAMKSDLAAIVEAIPLEEESDLKARISASMAAIERFVAKFP